MKWLGVDIGGANLKIANGDGFAKSRPFALWMQPDALGTALAELLSQAPSFDGLAVTMTGELADCYSTREEGVCRILDQLTSIVPAPMVRVYGVDHPWRTVIQAARSPWQVAASNWHGLASYVCRFASRTNAILIDAGSTTVDIIPIVDGRVATDAQCDSQRLRLGQLVYTGVERTPLCALCQSLPLHDDECPVMAERFATTLDVYLWLGEIDEQPDCLDTADSRPRTRQHAAFRLARMVGEDASTLADQDIDALANRAAQVQADLVAMAISRQRVALGLDESCLLITSGHGNFLVEAALDRLHWDPERLALADEIGAEVARCAPAFAISRLAEERFKTLDNADPST